MYEILLLNEKGEKFSKVFESFYMYEKALIKYKKSKKVTVISYGQI